MSRGLKRPLRHKREALGHILKIGADWYNKQHGHSGRDNRTSIRALSTSCDATLIRNHGQKNDQFKFPVVDMHVQTPTIKRTFDSYPLGTTRNESRFFAASGVYID